MQVLSSGFYLVKAARSNWFQYFSGVDSDFQGVEKKISMIKIACYFKVRPDTITN